MASVLREPLVLPEDLLVIPVSELSEDIRRKLGDGGEEFALTRPSARQPSKLIDASAAGLIERFRKPITIVQAVISYSREHNADPERILEESLPLLRQMIGAEMLVPAETEGAHAIVVSLTPGDLVGGYRILRSIQVFEDSELYQARAGDGSYVALKIARPKRAAQMRHFLAREEAALHRLAGRASPRLIESGSFDDRPFLATSWISGIDATTEASRLRGEGSRSELLPLLVEIARAYAGLHEAGILHGDIHPGNLLVGRQGEVTLIDFGLSQTSGISQARTPRGGVGFFLEPEYARAALEKRPPPPATERSEQFAVAALIYLLAAGDYYMDFTLEEEGLLRQIAAAAPLPFGERGLDPWPKLEAALARALARDPDARFPNMSAFAGALAEAAIEAPAPAPGSGVPAETFQREVLDRLGLDGPLFRSGLPQAPQCSVNFGAAGIAYALYRMACRRDDPRLLSLAEAWIDKAQRESDREDAFTNREMDLTEATVGRISPYHARPGVHLVRALIAEAGGDRAARDAAVSDSLLSIEAEPCGERDLTLGRSGAVLACATLLELLPETESPLRQRARGIGERLLCELWTEVATFDALAQGGQWPNLGIAHGWGGLMYATLRWHAIAGTALPPGFRDRLAQLMECARPVGRGIEWPWRDSAHQGREASMPGWCNGSAGMVHLACLARAVLGEASLLAVAEAAAWHAWDQGDGPVDLCCGLAGRAYALLELFRATHEPILRQRANSLIARAVRLAPQLRTAEHPPHSLYKGELGLAVLIADVEDPSEAAMPLFASERWRLAQ